LEAVNYCVAILIVFLVYRAILLFFFLDSDFVVASKKLPFKAFQNKCVWITGASSGIGEELAHQFVQNGATVILSARREAELERVKQDIVQTNQAAGESIHLVPMDMANAQSIDDAAKHVLKEFGPVDYLINNAGISQRILAIDTDMATNEQIMNVNYFGPVRLTKALLPSMMERKSGLVSVISSASGKFGSPMRSGYCGSKFAVLGYFSSLRLELIGSGVDVSIICPGFVSTPISFSAIGPGNKAMGVSDPFNAKGMTVGRCGKLILTAISHRLGESWVSSRRELVLMYLSQYTPSLFFFIVKKAAPNYIKEIQETCHNQ